MGADVVKLVVLPVLVRLLGPLGVVGVPTVPVTVMFVLAAPEALHPVASTAIWAAPENEAFQFTVADVPALVILPAPVGDNDQLYPVALDKDVVA